MGNVAKYQHGWNMTFTVVELLMIIPKSTYLSISLPYFSIYHFFSLTLFNNIHNIIYTIEKYNTFFGVNPFPINIHRRIIAILIVANYFQCCIDRILCTFSIYSDNILFFPVKLIVIHILEVSILFQIFVKNWSCR